jgi:hypothetical protein
MIVSLIRTSGNPGENKAKTFEILHCKRAGTKRLGACSISNSANVRFRTGTRIGAGPAKEAALAQELQRFR